MSTKISYRNIIALYTGWWVLWITLLFFQLHHLGVDYFFSAANSLITNLFPALCGVIIFNMMRFYSPRKENSFYIYIWVILIAVFCSLAENWLLQKINSSDNSYFKFLDLSLPLRFGYNFFMIAFVSLLSWIVNYFRNEQESEKRKTDTEQLAREAELIGLRQQMQPHFLFNSLNSISALAGSKPAEARKMIQQLSDFLRGTLKKDDKQFINFEEELNHLQLYLEIEKVRFGHRLKTKIVCDENCLTMKIPSLLLQPVVENAIKFGLYDTTEEIEITISAKVDSHFLIISVTNPFDVELSQPQRGTGFGLSSVQRRLQLLYMRNDLLETTTNENIFITTIKIPQLI